jgi:hypothetical protein
MSVSEINTDALAKITGASTTDIYNWIRRGLFPDFSMGLPIARIGSGYRRVFTLREAFFVSLVVHLRVAIPICDAVSVAKKVIDYDLIDETTLYSAGGWLWTVHDYDRTRAYVVFSPKSVIEDLETRWPK